MGVIVHDIKSLASGFECCVFTFVGRAANSVAHILTSKGLSGLGYNFWIESPPNWLFGSLLRDESIS